MKFSLRLLCVLLAGFVSRSWSERKVVDGGSEPPIFVTAIEVSDTKNDTNIIKWGDVAPLNSTSIEVSLNATDSLGNLSSVNSTSSNSSSAIVPSLSFSSNIPSATPSSFPTVPPSAVPSLYSTIPSNAEYFENPKLKWFTKLEGTGLFEGEAKLASGNAVLSSPDGVLVYVTLDNGSITTLSANDGTFRWSYHPEPIGSGWRVSCSSGVYFGSTISGQHYAVYAVTDVPPNTGTENYSSRIVAVTHPTNRLQWISKPVAGVVQGTPIITKVDPGLYIFFTHNNKNMESGDEVGSFTMMSGLDGEILFSEVAGDSRIDPGQESLNLVSTLRLPYSALGVSHSPEYGKYPGGEGNDHDLFIWSASESNSTGDKGYTRAFQLPKLFEPAFAPSLFTRFLRETRWNAVAAPGISKNGMEIVFGATENGIKGWTGTKFFDEVGDLEQTLDADPEDKGPSIPFQPVFSQSERFILTATSTNVLYAIQSETGKLLWSVSDTFPLSAKPVVSHDDLFVYTTRENGVIAAIDLRTGSQVWSFSCADIATFETISQSVSRAAGFCVDLIDAESSISPNGLILYFGDKFGNIKALQLGDSTIPTAMPSEFPTFLITSSPSDSPSASPSSGPSHAPSAAPSMIPQPTTIPTLRPTLKPIDWDALMSTDRSSAGTFRKFKEVGWKIALATLTLGLGFDVWLV